MLNKRDFEQLFKQHYQKMYLRAKMLLHDSDAAKDMVSEVFMAIAEDKMTLPDDHPEQYLLRCVRNRCLNQLNHQKVADRVHQLLRLENQPTLTSEEKEEDRYEQVLAFIDQQLTPQTARILRLHYQKKEKYREIAEHLGISEAAVYKHLSQGINQLKKHFNP